MLDVLAYVVFHPWKTLMFLVLAAFAISTATWSAALVALIVAAFVAAFDT